MRRRLGRGTTVYAWFERVWNSYFAIKKHGFTHASFKKCIEFIKEIIRVEQDLRRARGGWLLAGQE